MNEYSSNSFLGNAGDEIEYKWLLSGFPDKIEFSGSVKIEQGYIKGREQEIRIRKTVKKNAETNYTINAKKGLGLVRKELEYPIRRQLYELLFLVAKDYSLAKTRYYYHDNAELKYEIDRYHGALDGLCTMELEIISPEQDFEIPPLLKKCIIKNVTGDPAWLNSTLCNPQSPNYPGQELVKFAED